MGGLASFVCIVTTTMAFAFYSLTTNLLNSVPSPTFISFPISSYSVVGSRVGPSHPTSKEQLQAPKHHLVRHLCVSWHLH